MTWKPVPLPDGSYSDPDHGYSYQDVVNLWVEYAEGEGTRSPKKLCDLPGLKPFAEWGDGPHRAIRNVEGNLFLVSDTHAYQLSSNGTTVTRLGEIPGRGRCWITYNQITNGYQVLFSTGAEAWIWNTVTEDWAQITDDAFKGAIAPVYINSRFVAIEAQGRFFANSALAAGLSWDSIERYESESSPDRLVALATLAGELVAFNKSTIEFFQNTTNPEDIANHIYFTRVGAAIPVGGASKHGVSLLDGRLFFLASDGSARVLSGYGNPQRITTPAIETAWQACDLTKAFCFTYERHGHSVWYVTFPDGHNGHTWGYDCLASARAGRPIWHRRESKGLNRWRLNTLTEWNGRWVGGSYNSGVLYEVDWEYHLEGADEIERYFYTGVLHDEGNRVTVDGIRIETDTGHESTTLVEVEPLVIDDAIEGTFETMPFWVSVGGTELALRGTYEVPVIGTDGISSDAIGEDTMPLGGDYALTYANPGGNTLYAWKMNRTTGDYAAYTITSPVTSTAIAINRDGSWFVAMNGTTLYSFQNTGSGFTRVGTHAGLAYSKIAFDPDGDRFAAFSVADSRLDLFALDTSTGAMTIGAGGSEVLERMAWSRDGRYLAVGLSNPAPTAGTLTVYDTAGGTSSLTSVDTIGAMTSNRRGVCWNRDGSKIWYNSGSLGGLAVASFDGTNITHITDHSISADAVAEVQISPSGRYLMMVPFGTYPCRLYRISEEGKGSALTEVASGSYTADRGGGWTDFFDKWVDS